MSIQGLMSTLIWTELSTAVNADFDIELPLKSGKETTKVIRELVKLCFSSQPFCVDCDGGVGYPEECKACSGYKGGMQ